MGLRERLRSGETLAGTVLTVGDLSLAQLAATPFDFVWIDLEHGALTVRDVQQLAIAAAAADSATLVRLPHARSERLQAVLDAGVDGIVAPRVRCADEAAELADRMRHPPAGSRGFAHRRWNGWGRADDEAVTPACIVQIESREAVAAASEIAAVPGVDALVLGPADLALDLGVPAALDGPEMGSAISAVQRAADEAGIVAGIAAGGDADVLGRALGGRFTFLVYSADVRLYAEATAAAATTARRALTSVREAARS
jgi:4-hydroxy-2-oxoheptanedioate aldolase